MTGERPLVIGVGGLTSEVGKTTLLCKLLRAFPGWEAIKTTRGHYRSCGKDPDACCVSDLLAAEPVIRSGRNLTYAPGKDSGRYWEAGAVNVHWLIATDAQVGQGIKQTLARVKAPGVFIEGNSFAEFIVPDFFIMVARAGQVKIKPTARRALPRVSAVYLSDESDLGGDPRGQSGAGRLSHDYSWNDGFAGHTFNADELPQLVARLKQLESRESGKPLD